MVQSPLKVTYMVTIQCSLTKIHNFMAPSPKEELLDQPMHGAKSIEIHSPQLKADQHVKTIYKTVYMVTIQCSAGK